MLYLNLDKNGYLLSVYETYKPVEGAPSIESLEGIDLSGCRINAYRWKNKKLVLDETRLEKLLSEEAEREAQSNQPSPLEQLMADRDFIFIMEGWM